MNPTNRLSPRLNAIFELVAQAQQDKNYQNIWDCCCDHGYLGIKILCESLCEKLIFVDRLPHLIEQLTIKLKPFDTGRHELLTADAGDLIFDSQFKHLVILAGVGGETTVEILKSIEANHSNTQIDYIFCPSASHNDLREYLSEHNYGLLDELLVCENKRYYEIIMAKSNGVEDQLAKISKTCNMWDDDNSDHQRYLTKINTPRTSKKPKRKRLMANKFNAS